MSFTSYTTMKSEDYLWVDAVQAVLQICSCGLSKTEDLSNDTVEQTEKVCLIRRDISMKEFTSTPVEAEEGPEPPQPSVLPADEVPTLICSNEHSLHSWENEEELPVQQAQVILQVDPSLRERCGAYLASSKRWRDIVYTREAEDDEATCKMEVHQADPHDSLIVLNNAPESIIADIAMVDPVMWIKPIINRVYFVERRARRLETMVERVLHYHPELKEGSVRILGYPKVVEQQLAEELGKRGVELSVSHHMYVLFAVRHGAKRKKFCYAVRRADACVGAFSPVETFLRRRKEEKLSGIAGREESICRARYKMEEVLMRGLIKPITPQQLVLDIGAAPGGWTAALSELGARVISVDPAPLKIMPTANVLHFMCQAQNALEPIQAQLQAAGQKFDMIVCDANINPQEAWGLVGMYLPFARSGCKVVLTCKCSRHHGLKAEVARTIEIMQQQCKSLAEENGIPKEMFNFEVSNVKGMMASCEGASARASVAGGSE
ncbi:hypothetical protein CYMTET_30330 [Cymbomonas tetramitiformis]|uniref:Ribosomal RNA methyltransferase FtsJ domain-containing protein n=1 Tax=Cymbomonas tetramitiformis TaxID=36881 RepID=A0AAE0KU20_9CHLO|nr:hypothetical protein CYMTET_30330 [Cymbomonas tetramitiformis]